MSTPITYQHELMDRYRLIYDWVPEGVGRLLDIGCGNGVFTQWFRRKAREVYGTDHNGGQLAWAREHFPGLELVTAAGETLAFPDGHFDVVIMSDVLEHMDDDRRGLHEALRVLRPGGLLIISLPNRGPLAILDGDNLVNRFVAFLAWLRIPKGGGRGRFYEGFQFRKHRHYGLRELLALIGDAARVEQVYYGGVLLWPLAYLVEKILEVFFKRPLVTRDYRRLRRLRAWDFRRGIGRWSYNLIVALRKPA